MLIGHIDDAIEYLIRHRNVEPRLYNLLRLRERGVRPPVGQHIARFFRLDATSQNSSDNNTQSRLNVSAQKLSASSVNNTKSRLNVSAQNLGNLSNCVETLMCYSLLDS